MWDQLILRTLITLMMHSCSQLIQITGPMRYTTLKHNPTPWAIHTNWLKTRIQNVGAGAGPNTIYINNQAVEYITMFTYLDSDVDSDGYCDSEIHIRLGIASSIMSQLDNVWRQQRLSLSTTLRIYVSLVMSVVGGAIRLLDVDHEKNGQWQGPVISHAISTPYPGSEMVSQDHQIPFLIADRRHSLLGHICVSREIPLSQALHLSIDTFCTPATDWKRPPGRPRRTWLQHVEEDMGLPISACQFATLDLSLWRSQPSAGQAHQWVSEWVLSLTIFWTQSQSDGRTVKTSNPPP